LLYQFSIIEGVTMLEAVRLFQALHANRRGVTAVEYGIMAALISAVLITAVATFTGALPRTFARIASRLT
jgi:pilus assembly protein Flp/PilA